MMKGQYLDRLVDKQGRIQQDHGWSANVIVNDCNRLLAVLMKGHEGFFGILYLAVGEGLKEWDVSRPHPDPATTRLAGEILRCEITPDNIFFLDSSNQPSVTPTNRLEIMLQFSRDDFAADGFQSVREFGLFGGNATGETNSGLMINHVIHPRIDISAELTLARTLRLDFSFGSAWEEECGGFGAGLAVRNIDGVGDVYSAVLNAEGIATLADLIEIDPLLQLGNIPVVKLREFRAKARMIMAFQARFSPFMDLSDRSISDLIRESPDVLAGMVHSSVVTPNMIAAFQEDLMSLQVAMDDSQLKKITLADLAQLVLHE